MNNKLGVMSFSCSSDTSHVLLLNAIFQKLNNVAGVSNTEMFSVKTKDDLENKEDKFFITFNCRSMVDLPKLLLCEDIKKVLINIARIDFNDELSLDFEKGILNINHFLTTYDLCIAYYDKTTKQAVMFSSGGEYSAKGEELNLDIESNFGLADLISAQHSLTRCIPFSQTVAKVTDLRNACAEDTNDYKRLNEEKGRLNSVGYICGLHSLDFIVGNRVVIKLIKFFME